MGRGLGSESILIVEAFVDLPIFCLEDLTLLDDEALALPDLALPLPDLVLVLAFDLVILSVFFAFPLLNSMPDLVDLLTWVDVD